MGTGSSAGGLAVIGEFVHTKADGTIVCAGASNALCNSAIERFYDKQRILICETGRNIPLPSYLRMGTPPRWLPAQAMVLALVNAPIGGMRWLKKLARPQSCTKR